MTRPDPVLYDQHTRPLHARIAELEAKLEELREKYEAMRLEWSKAVDERDDLTVANTRLANRLRDHDAEPDMPDSTEWTVGALKAECRRLASLRDRAMEDAEKAEAERDDYKDRWQIVGRVGKKMLDKLDAENQQLRRALDAEMREKINRTANYEAELAQLRTEEKT
jgi:regulator of replication initiation timing